MIMQEAREQIVEYSKKMSAAGLSVGTSGNISFYDKETGYMAISPSGLGYFDTTPEDVVVMDLDGNIIDGKRKPSSEHGLHTIFYRNRPEAGAVVHTHSPYCTTLACMGETLKSVHYVIMGTGVEEVPLTPYVTFGTPELAEAVGETLKANPKTRATLLANHGIVVCQANLPKAFGLAVNCEFVAQVQYQCLCAGKMNLISHEEMEKAFERSKTYGQVPDKK